MQPPQTTQRIKVLVAADAADTAAHVANVAHATFGDDAEYLVINVSTPDGLPMLGWGTPTPMMMPFSYPLFMGGATNRTSEELAEESTGIADAAAVRADLPDAQSIASSGDVCSSILEAAHVHGADVIVVGSHERSWFDRLTHRSVSHDVLARAALPVLVAPTVNGEPS